MRYIASGLFLTIVTILSFTGFHYAQAQSTPLPNGAPSSFADMVEGLLPTVVNISSTQKMENIQDLPDMPHFPPGSPFEDFFEEFMDRHEGEAPMAPPASLGSGFVIDAENGYVVTNAHVIKGADEVRVTFYDDTTLEAEVIGSDEKTDLAVLKVSPEKPIHGAKFGDSDKMRIGDWIVAIGNPFGLGSTVTAGIVSAQQRNINAGPYDDFIQTDASINRGNSGGPMFNLDGEVIGINTAIFSPSGGSVGIGFSIPSNLAKPVIKQIIEYGHTRRGWMGVRIQSVTQEIAESLGLEEASGALVASVTADGPADKAKLKPGDIVLKFNGHKIKQMRELPRIVAETKIGTKADVEFWRNGKKQKTAIEVGELEKAEEEGLLDDSDNTPEEVEGFELEDLGLTLSNLTNQKREQMGLDADTQGALVTRVNPESDAASKGLAASDVIVEVNQKTISTPQGAIDQIAQAKKAKRKSVLLLVNRGGDVRFIALKLKTN